MALDAQRAIINVPRNEVTRTGTKTRLSLDVQSEPLIYNGKTGGGLTRRSTKSLSCSRPKIIRVLAGVYAAKLLVNVRIIGRVACELLGTSVSTNVHT